MQRNFAWRIIAALAIWVGLAAPAPTQDWQARAVRITGDPAFQKKNFVDRAIDYAVNTPEEFAKFIERDRKSAERIFKGSGQQPQ